MVKITDFHNASYVNIAYRDRENADVIISAAKLSPKTTTNAENFHSYTGIE